MHIRKRVRAMKIGGKSGVAWLEKMREIADMCGVVMSGQRSGDFS
jgi:hypothetical protein